MYKRQVQKHLCKNDLQLLKEIEERHSYKIVQNNIAVPTFLHTSETSTLGKKEENKIQADKMKFSISAQGYSLLGTKRNENIRQELKIEFFYTKFFF